jgi:serine/threonine protein kinase/tetratricopeptide (TPR) repeat protein
MKMSSTAIPERISHYRILNKIGAGGMGEVYLAEDTHLNRKVAIKFLSSESVANEEARKRLIREAQAVARLDHPNICVIHEVAEEDGRSFIVMQYIEGETLASRLREGPPELKESLDVAVQLADAVSEAHSQGVLHRDLKPQNIMITSRGQVKVMDFGLAKALTADLPTGNDSETLSVLTEPGTVMGTVPYMSPEQVRGEALGARSDIFSLGSVLYEMISGRQPFTSGSAGATLSAILTSEPPPLARYTSDVPEELQRIVRKCLEKDVERRYQTARDVMIDLDNCRREQQPVRTISLHTVAPTRADTTTLLSDIRRPAFMSRRALLPAMLILALVLALAYIFVFRRSAPATRKPEISSLAILPLKNLSGDQSQEYLADGMTEALIAELSRIGALRVISRTSSMQYKNTDKLMTQVASELNVEGVIEGSMFREGDQVRITVQLIHGPTDNHLWTESYQREVRGILRLQSDIARAIATEVRIQLTAPEKERLSGAPSFNPEAHDAYLRGRYYWNKEAREDLERAREYFEQAVQKDPRYAPAYAGLADYYSALPFYTNARADDVFPKAKEAVAKALELDGSLAEAHGTHAYILAYYDWNWTDADQAFKRSLALNPNDATQRHRYSRYLASLGRVEESLRELERARLLDPLDLVIKANVGVINYFARRYDQAIEDLQNILRDHPDFRTANWGLGLAYEQKASYQQALAELQKASARRAPNALASLGHLYGVMGRKQQAGEILTELKTRAREENISAYQFALVHIGMGETKEALDALQQAYRERSTLLGYLKMDPRFDPLRNDSRFQEIMTSIGLAQ